MNRSRREFVGADDRHMKDMDGKPFMREIVDIARSAGGGTVPLGEP